MASFGCVLCVMMTWALFTPSIAQTVLSTEGKKFIVYPSRVAGLWDRVTLYITTRSISPVQVRVYTPLKSVSRGGVDIRRVVQLDRPLTLEVSADGRSQSTKLYDGIVVWSQSDKDIAIFVNNPSSNASGVTSILSSDSLGTRYLFPSIKRTYGAQTSILIGNTDHDVINEIQVTLPSGLGGPSLIWMDTQYGPGQSFLIKMNRNEFADIRQREGTGSGDLTGTRITARKPVAVFSASVFLPSSGSSDPAFSVDKDITIENIPPVNLWGKTFVVSASPSRSSGDSVRILAGEPYVTVHFNRTTTVTLANAGSFFETDILPNNSLFLQADKAIQVIQYRFDFTADSAPFMFLVPAVESYASQYTVPIIFDDSLPRGLPPEPRVGSQNHLVLVTHACYADRVMLTHTNDSGHYNMGLVSKMTSWRRVEGSSFMTSEVKVEVGFLTISMVASEDLTDDSKVAVGGFFFGMGPNKAYAAALGLHWNKDKPDHRWPNTASSETSGEAPVQDFKSRLIARDKMPLAFPLSTAIVRSRPACHQACWTYQGCSFVAYSKLKDPHALTSCTLLGPTAGCSGLVSHPDNLLYRVDKA